MPPIWKVTYRFMADDCTPSGVFAVRGNTSSEVMAGMVKEIDEIVSCSNDVTEETGIAVTLECLGVERSVASTTEGS